MSSDIDRALRRDVLASWIDGDAAARVSLTVWADHLLGQHDGLGELIRVWLAEGCALGLDGSHAIVFLELTLVGPNKRAYTAAEAHMEGRRHKSYITDEGGDVDGVIVITLVSRSDAVCDVDQPQPGDGQ